VREEVGRALDGVAADEADRFAREIIRTHGSGARVYVAGAGRSGLVSAAFAMRLVHLGFVTHAVGEATAPGVGRGDLLIMASGSGRTRTAIAQADAAKARGARVAAVTGDRTSPLARKADLVVQIPCPPYAKRKERPRSLAESTQPGGTLFEQSLLLFFDGLVLDLARRTGWSAKILKQRHANLE
jgi:6-phospho-3-hexuloisomerase